MHSLASRYVKSLWQLQARLRPLAESSNGARGRDSRHVVHARDQPQPNGIDLQARPEFIADASDVGQVGDTNEATLGLPNQPTGDESTLLLDDDLGDPENLLYSPGWTGLMDDWNWA